MKGNLVCVVLCAVLAFTIALPDSRCPAVDDPEQPPVLLPHSYNCSAFLICSHGDAIESPCPPGLHWNDYEKQCDYPAQAQCYLKMVNIRMVTCPAEYDPDHAFYSAHETDCDKYYICDANGIPLEQDCPPGLHWNPLVSYCDFPEQAQCEL